MTGGECPTGCGRSVSRGHLMCRPCWGEVPQHLQAEVNRTWRAWRRDFGNTEAIRAYRAARDDAIAAVA